MEGVLANAEGETFSVMNSRTRKVGLLLDTGAFDNIGGTESAWFKQFTEQMSIQGYTPEVRAIDKISVSGVGSGAAETTRAYTFPGAAVDVDGVARTVAFDTPIAEGSPIPPLWGLQSLRKHRALIDCHGLKLHLLGADDSECTFPQGTLTFPLELSDSGHLILPIGEFDKLSEQSQIGHSEKKLSFAASTEVVEVPLHRETPQIDDEPQMVRKKKIRRNRGSASKTPH